MYILYTYNNIYCRYISIFKHVYLLYCQISTFNFFSNVDITYQISSKILAIIISLISEMQCFLHIGKNISRERIIAFTKESLQNCHTKQKIRNQVKKKKSKYDDIAGYHPSCHRFFTSIKIKHSQTDNEKER